MECPTCYSTRFAKLLYGEIQELAHVKEQIEHHEVVLAGVAHFEGDPTHQCLMCGTRVSFSE